MIPDSALPTLRATCRTLQIIVMALATGVCIFAVIAVVKTKGQLTWECVRSLSQTEAFNKRLQMDIETFLKRLEKAKYFEGYSDSACTKAIKLIRKRHQDGMAGEQKEYFERFPGLALVVIDVDQEMMGLDDLAIILRDFGKVSLGMFGPQSIKIRRTRGDEQYQLDFTVHQTKYSLKFEDDSWIPNEFFEELDKVTRSECAGLAFHSIAYPDPGQSGFYVWCTTRAFKAISRAGLIPSEQHLLDAAEQEIKQRRMADLKAAANRIDPRELAEPADVARAERMKVFKKGQWKIPTLSRTTLETWQEIAASQSMAATGSELTKEINRNYDLLCAKHCGMRRIGDAGGYARRVTALVDRYLYGTWRVGYVKDGVKFTEAKARKELLWSLALPAGCAVAASVSDQLSLSTFLKYVQHNDVYNGGVGDDLAYYRLLSDCFLGQSKWNWNEQAGIIESGFDNRLKNLLKCLTHFRANEAAKFNRAILKLRTKPPTAGPIWFAAVVDEELSTLAYLARRKGWQSDGFPDQLQDKILDRQAYQHE